LEKMSLKLKPAVRDRNTGGRQGRGQLAGGQGDKWGGVGVCGRKQLRPSIVNITIKQWTEDEPAGDCRGSRKVGRCSSGRLRELGYVRGSSGSHGDVAGGHIRCSRDGQVRMRSAQQQGYDKAG
jgi:hypothetical protein